MLVYINKPQKLEDTPLETGETGKTEETWETRETGKQGDRVTGRQLTKLNWLKVLKGFKK